MEESSGDVEVRVDEGGDSRGAPLYRIGVVASRYTGEGWVVGGGGEGRGVAARYLLVAAAGEPGGDSAVALELDEHEAADAEAILLHDVAGGDGAEGIVGGGHSVEFMSNCVVDLLGYVGSCGGESCEVEGSLEGELIGLSFGRVKVDRVEGLRGEVVGESLGENGGKVLASLGHGICLEGGLSGDSVDGLCDGCKSAEKSESWGGNSAARSVGLSRWGDARGGASGVGGGWWSLYIRIVISFYSGGVKRHRVFDCEVG